MFITLLWRLMLTDFHDFGINEKKTLPCTMVPNNLYFGGVSFKFTGGGNHPFSMLRKTCYKKGQEEDGYTKS